MDSQHNNLWAGGKWEQASPQYPSPPIIKTRDWARERDAYLASIRRKKAKKQAIWGFSSMLSLIFLLTGSIALTRHFSPIPVGEEPPSITWGQDGWADLIPNEPNGPDAPAEDEMIAPDIRQAATGTGVIVDIQKPERAVLTPQENYSSNLKSIVFIETTSRNTRGTGTGIILTESGYIITNAHVVSGGNQVEVILWDERVLDAQLVGWDADEDLAVLKVDANDLTPAVFGDSELLQVGDTAYAMGNPLGAEYRSTFTDGIISALDRYVRVDDVYMNLIQTTAPINFGNSGGALLNDSGQVVGITTIKIMSDEGTVESMGFAIPSTRVKQVVDQLIAGNNIETPALGITVIPTGEPSRGLLVEDVNPMSDAAEKGLQAGDIILEANGKLTYKNSDLARIKDKLMVGDLLSIVILRDDETLELSIVMEKFQDVH